MTGRKGNKSAPLGVPQGLTTAMLRRRSLLRGAVVGATTLAIGVPLSGCTDEQMRRSTEGSGVLPSVSATTAAGAIIATPGTPPATATKGEASAIVAPTSVSSATSGSARAATTSPRIAGSPAVIAPARSRVLLAYFSRAGENYYYGGRTQLAVGNTEVLAGMITQMIGCDTHRIAATEPYPDDYEETVARNVREQNAIARPAIANLLPSLDSYDTILLGSPIWNVRPPLIMATFAGRHSFAGKRVFPFVTYAVSGLGATARDYAAWCPGATIGEGLAVRGEEVSAGGPAAEAWLRRSGLLNG